jgi:hypothetical protein
MSASCTRHRAGASCESARPPRAKGEGSTPGRTHGEVLRASRKPAAVGVRFRAAPRRCRVPIRGELRRSLHEVRDWHPPGTPRHGLSFCLRCSYPRLRRSRLLRSACPPADALFERGGAPDRGGDFVDGIVECSHVRPVIGNTVAPARGRWTRSARVTRQPGDPAEGVAPAAARSSTTRVGLAFPQDPSCRIRATENRSTSSVGPLRTQTRRCGAWRSAPPGAAPQPIPRLFSTSGTSAAPGDGCERLRGREVSAALQHRHRERGGACPRCQFALRRTSSGCVLRGFVRPPCGRDYAFGGGLRQ